MSKLLSRVGLAMIVLSTLLVSPSVVLADPDTTNCLYPTPADRFGVTVYADQQIGDFDVTPLAAARYLNWRADLAPEHPNAMGYYFVVRIGEGGHQPGANDLKTIASANPGSTWVMGNEADVIWQDNASPAAYARGYHSAYTAIKSVDPRARFVMNGVGQVSPLRLAWLDQVWDSYYTTYGVEIPVDVWNIHTYIANEMHLEWGSEIPPGIPNAVGFSSYLGTHWSQLALPGASGGTVHQSKTLSGRAIFAFHGEWVTIMLATGPDAGIAAIYLDQDATPVTEIDLYAPTPGTLTRTYSGLTPRPGLLGDRHNIRIQVTGQRNPASSNTWIRVDAMQAPSTAALPAGRFEDNSPLRAMIISSVNDHDNIDLIAQQIRQFRQWMVNRGQRNKPLINTEHGILMTEDLGFPIERVQAFMVNSFNYFLNNLIDPALGYPEDDNRLLQEWFWFALSVEQFEGRAVQTGLFHPVTRAIKPLGQTFADYVQPLHQDYVDLGLSTTTVTPYWPIFAGEPSVLRIQSLLSNRGNIASGPFDVTFRAGSGALLATQPFAGLPKRYDPGFETTLSHDWQIVTTSPRGMRIVVDESNQIAEPCNTNNEAYVQVATVPGTDLALSNLRTDPTILPPTPPGTTTTFNLQVDLRNLGTTGTAASQVQVKFWNGNPNAGGVLIGSQTLNPGGAPVPLTVSQTWPNVSPGRYTIYVVVEPVAEETNLQNNTISANILLPGSVVQLPLIGYRLQTPRSAQPSDAAHPLWQFVLPAVASPANGQ